MRRRAIVAMMWLAMLPAAPLSVHAQAPPVPVRGADALPETIPLFPLDNLQVFPGRDRILHIFEPRYRAMMADALKGDRVIGMAQLRPGYEADYEGRPPIFAIGCAGAIAQYEQLEDGRYNLVLTGLVRFRILSEDQSRPYRVARVEPLPEAEPDERMLAAIAAQKEKILTLIEPGVADRMRELPAEDLINSLAMSLKMTGVERQALLERNDIQSRGAALLDLLSKP